MVHRVLSLERPPIRLVVFDVDGTLTDGTSLFGLAERGLRFHAHDGFGIGMLRASGIEVAFVSAAGWRHAVHERAKQLDVELCYQEVKDKAAMARNLAGACDVESSAIAWMGDDLNDVEAMLACGLAIAPANAMAGAKAAAHYVTVKRGGEGAVREAAEFILRHNAERAT